MSTRFSDFMQEVEAEARREGPGAVAEGEALRAHFRLARELLELRQRRGLTQRQLSGLAGVQQSEISRIESASGNPTIGTINALAAALGAEVRLQAGRRRAPASSAAATAGRRVRAAVSRHG